MPIMRFREVMRRVRALFTFSDPGAQPIDRIISMALGLDGNGVTRELALSVPGVLRARNLIVGSICTLPLEQIDGSRRPVASDLLEQIDPDIANVVTLAQVAEDLLFDAISWWEILETGRGNFPVKARRRDPNTVSLQPPNDGRTRAPLPSLEDPRSAVVYVDGREVPASRMIRFDSPNPGILQAARRAIRRAVFLDKMAEMYAKNPRPLDYFSPKEDADPADDDQIREMLADWRQARESGSTGYVPYAVEYNTVDVPSPADLQILEQQRFAAVQVANATGLDPEDLGVSTTSRTYQNAVDRRIDKINETFAPYMRAITDRLSMADITPPGHRVRFNVDEYLRADPLTRWRVYEIALRNDVVDAEEVREEEALPVGAPTPRPAAAPVQLPDNVRQIRAGSGFAADGPRRIFDLPVTNFAVDTQRRTIEGLAVPYGETAQKFWRTFEFAPGALQLPAITSRNKLLRDHDYSQAIGVLTFAEDRPDGVFVRYRIAGGPEGDRALALAADGVLDGLSVGTDFEDADTIPHPSKPGVTYVRRADWLETSLTAMPSFDGARVTRVAASSTGGTMPCTECGHVHAAGTPHVTTAPTTAPTTTPPAAPPAAAPAAPVTFAATPTDFAAAFAAFMATQYGTTPETPQAVAQPVDATAHAVPGPVGVREPAPYRFDRGGNLGRGSHDFSSDLYQAIEAHDDAAMRRAVTFAREQFVITTDVATLNPTTQRPDMYVDQRDFRYPVWESIVKGTLTENTPFTFPKFSSATALVAAHVEGTEPALGTFVATSQTITPTGNSGKIKITRETWDQGGNPQLSGLIWRQMVKAWFEALEAFAVSVLDLATPTGITFTTAGGVTGQTLALEIDRAWADLQYVRGGFTMDTAFAQIDLYRALAAARDTTGRALYPRLGPMNAAGQVADRMGAIDVSGVTFHPAWALAATGVVAASSYLFDRDCVWGWASAPQRIDIDKTEVANVYIGLWGYKAGAISDINGVRELIYDPV
jgi:HK97 family phage prohead protease